MNTYQKLKKEKQTSLDYLNQRMSHLMMTLVHQEQNAAGIVAADTVAADTVAGIVDIAVGGDIVVDDDTVEIDLVVAAVVEIQYYQAFQRMRNLILVAEKHLEEKERMKKSKTKIQLVLQLVLR